MTGFAVVIGYALLGATWLVLKTEGDLQVQMRGYAWWLGAGTLGLIGLVSIFTPFQDPIYFERWFNLPGSLWVMIVPLLMAGLTWSFFIGLNDQSDARPFLSALGFFVVSFIGIGISFYPMMVPPSLTIWQAAAPDSSLAFALVGAVILIPIILAYTAYAYWVFRGKMDPSEGYH